MAAPLDGRVALVTGGARGIGAAIASALAEAGARVAVGDLDADAAGAGGALGVELDVSRPDSVRAAVARVAARLGPVDVLVNNAGIDVIELFVDSDPADWDRVIDVNLKGTLHCCRAVLDAMIERGSGRIVNLGSDAGRRTPSSPPRWRESTR